MRLESLLAALTIGVAVHGSPRLPASPRETSDGAELRVHVRDVDGRPLPEARVFALAQDDPALASLGHGLPIPGSRAAPARRLEARTNARGFARLPCSPHRLYRVWASSPDGLQVSSIRSHVLAHERKPGAGPLVLLPAARLHVKVPELRFRYTLHTIDREVREEFLLQSGIAKGERVFEALPPGTYRLRIVASDARSRELRVTLRPGQRHERTPRLVLPARLAFSTPGPGETGVARVRIPELLEPPGATPQGTERVVPALGLVLRVLVETESGLRIPRELGPFESGQSYRHELRLPALRRVQLRVPGSARGLLILAWRQEGRLSWRSRRIDTSAESSRLVEIDGLPRARTLALFLGDEGERAAREIDATPAAEALPLEPASEVQSLRLEVRLEDGRPAAGALVLLQPVDLNGAGSLTNLHPELLRYTDPRGFVDVPALLPGSWQLRVQKELFVPDERLLELRPGQELTRRIELQRGMRLRGRVLDADGRPAAGVLVTLTDQSVQGTSLVRETSTDSEGHYQFTGLPDGFYLAEARRANGSEAEIARARALRPGGEGVELRLRNEDPPLPGQRRQWR